MIVSTKKDAKQMPPIIFFAVTEDFGQYRGEATLERLFCGGHKPGANYVTFVPEGCSLGNFIAVYDNSLRKPQGQRILGHTLAASSPYLLRTAAEAKKQYVMYYRPDLCFQADDLFLYASGYLKFQDIRTAASYQIPVGNP